MAAAAAEASFPSLTAAGLPGIIADAMDDLDKSDAKYDAGDFNSLADDTYNLYDLYDYNLYDLAAVSPTYAEYMEAHAEAQAAKWEVSIAAADAVHTAGEGFRVLYDAAARPGASLYTGEQGWAEWLIDVPVSGLYAMTVEYYPVEGKSAAIERALLIDGELPFKEAAYLQFDRIWHNRYDIIQQDNRGNDLRPQQVEKPRWREAVLKDVEGRYAQPFLFYLSAGSHTITLLSQREPMILGEIRFHPYEQRPSYEDMLEYYATQGVRATSGIKIEIQGEDAVAKSSPTLYPLTERSTPAVTPYSPSQIRINTIGGYNWRLPGQWIEWEFEVPETGLYQIAFHSQQNFVRGIYSVRRLLIDEQVPFREMEQVAFRYKGGYRMDVMGAEEDGEPYLFMLGKGKHMLRLEVTLGEFASLIREVEESLLTLNAMYRKILMITGTAPDEVRDYQLNKKIPQLLMTFEAESQRLKEISTQLKELSGGVGDAEALLKSMYLLLDDMIEDPDKIPRRLVDYKINAGGLGTWLQRAREMPLEIDAIYIASPDVKLPKGGASWLAELWHEWITFLYSFFIDYNQIGNVAAERDQRTITVWIASGRDQANTLKMLIDETFTPRTGINVNLMLVQMHTLLPATLAGQGPDVAMQVTSDIPVNYAMRGAAVDLTQFPDFAEVAANFRESALVPYTYACGVYALPETQTFDMLFYRKDVLQELGLDVPETWEDVYQMLTVLKKHHMEFGLPLVLQASYPGENIPPNSVFAALLMQHGGQFYRDGGRASDLDSTVAVETFKMWTELYTDYKLEREFDFANRFRTGEMPIGLADYTMYNQLTVFAPEIRGLWGFAPVPGTRQEDGTVDRTVPSRGLGTIMLKQAKDQEAAWEFMKWWVSAETQTRYGREMEGLMGAAARYPTANIRALDSLPWPAADYNNLKAQFAEAEGIPEVPGGYFTGRHLLNAFYEVVVNEQTEPREAILSYVPYIQDEIAAKHKEFGLLE